MTGFPSETQLLEMAIEEQRARLSKYDPVTLVRLSAIPQWTLGLAECANVPPPVLTALADKREEITPEGDLEAIWSLSVSTRAEVCRHVRWTQPNMGLRSQVNELASLVRNSAVAREVHSWLRCLELENGARLVAEVDELLLTGDSDAAQDVVACAQALGDVLGEPMLSSARRARWRLDRAYREAPDARSLQHYLPRPLLERELLALCGPADPWALHLLGAGGVGKTMAVRDLVSGRFAERNGLDRFPVARVDFDHLDPSFPHRKPGELLRALATELVGYTLTRDAQEASRDLDDNIALWEEMRSSSGADTMAEPDIPDHVVEAFGRFVDELGDPVVLVLDTCEELAKLYSTGSRPVAIDYTMSIFERVRALTPHIRVLFAGRRWLVRPPKRALAGGLVLSRRDYLRVFPLEGFSAAEAEQYVNDRDERDLLSPELRAAVLKRSVRTMDGGANPFDLAGYCDWALDEPDLDPARLLSSTDDPYVQHRIIARITDYAVRDCLAAATALGRFDRAMIERHLRRRGVDPDAAFSGLVGQEWVSTVEFDTDGTPHVIEIDEQLLPRLRAVIEADPARFPLDRVRLGRDLVEVIESGPVEEVTAEAVEGALRLLPVAEAAAMWARLEERITAESAWGWVDRVVPRAAAVEAALRPDVDEPCLFGAILATQAACVLRQPGRPGVTQLYLDIGRHARRHPESLWRHTLEFRSLCGRMAAGEGGGQAVARQIVALWERLPDERRTDTALTMFDTLLARGLPIDPELLPMLDALCSHRSSEVTCAALLARAAHRLLQSEVDHAHADASRALAVFTRGTSSERWVEWVPPRHSRERAQLALLSIGSLRESHESTLVFLGTLETVSLEDIDFERAVSAHLRQILDQQLVDADLLDRIAKAEAYAPARKPTHFWHRRTSSLCASLAIAFAAVGEVDRAVRLMLDRRTAAVSAGDDPETVEECEYTLAFLCRTYRLRDLISTMLRLVRDVEGRTRGEAWAALSLLDGVAPESPDDAGSWHSWWQAQVGRPTFDFPPPEDEGLLAAADRVEYQKVRGLPASDEQRLVLAPELSRVRLGEVVDRDLQDALIGAVLRASAVLGDPPGLPVRSSRRVAQIALREGELLIARLPGPAHALLDLAAESFDLVGDQQAARHARVLMARAAHAANMPVYSDELGKRPDEKRFPGWAREYDAVRRLTYVDTPPTDASAAAPEEDAESAGRPVGWRWLAFGAAGVGGTAVVGAVAVGWLPFWPVVACIVAVVVSVAVFIFGRQMRLHSPADDGATKVWYLSTAYGLSEPGVWTPCAVSVTEMELEARKVLADEVFADQDGSYTVVPVVVGADELATDWEDRIIAEVDRPLVVRFRLTYWAPLSAYWEGHGLGVLHLIGKPVLTSAGWRLRVLDDAHSDSSSWEYTGRSTKSGEELIAVEEYSSSRGRFLIVLQEDPVEGPPRRLDRHRKGMFALARIISEGGQAVLILPPLSDSMSARAGALVRKLDQIYIPSLRNALDMVHEIRQMIGNPAVARDVVLIV